MKQPPRDPFPISSGWPARARVLIAAAALLLLGLALAEDAARALAGIGRLAASRILDWRGHERALGVAGSGQEVLPESVVGTVAALAASGAAAFRLSEGVNEDGFLHRRLAEVAWPLPIDPAAAVLVRLTGEASSCTPLAQHAGVAVDRCD